MLNKQTHAYKSKIKFLRIPLNPMPPLEEKGKEDEKGGEKREESTAWALVVVVVVTLLGGGILLSVASWLNEERDLFRNRDERAILSFHRSTGRERSIPPHRQG